MKKTLLLTCFVSCFLLSLMALPVYANSIGEWPLAYEARLGAGVVSIFRWDAETIGAFDSTKAEITLIRAGSGHTETVSLSHDFHAAPSGQVYPDIMRRGADGLLYWLSRPSQQIGVFWPDGELHATIPFDTAMPFWMNVLDDGLIRVFCSTPDGLEARYETFTYSGELLDVEPATTLGGPAPHLADRFFYTLPQGDTLELFAGLPLVRLNDGFGRSPGALGAFRLAPELGDLSTSALADSDDLGSGRRPFILTSALGPGGTVFAVLNGGKLLRIEDPGTVNTWKIPAQGVPFSMAAGDGWLAVLSNSGAVSLRVWDLGENPGQAPRWSASVVQEQDPAPVECEIKTLKCKTKNCPNNSTCEGHFKQTFGCRINCFKKISDDEVEASGSADCGPWTACPTE